jgi:O-antigen ligase
MYDWLIMGLLLLACTVGVILFGAVRLWSAGSLMVVVFMGAGLFLLRPYLQSNPVTLSLPPGTIPFALFLGYATALIPLAAVPFEAKIEALKIASYLLAYVIWTDLSQQDGRWRWLLGIPFAIGALVALYALVLHVRGSTAVLNLVRSEGYGMRASGTFMAPAHLGAYMGGMISLALAVCMARGAGVFLQSLGFYGLLVFPPVLVLSQSRSGLVGAFAGLAVTTGLLTWKRDRRWFWGSVAAFPVLAALALAVIWFAAPDYQERLTQAVQVEGSAAWRLEAWRDTVDMIQDEPVLGHGPGSYRWTYGPYQSWRGDRWLRYAHNEVLHLWAEYGVIGLLLMTGFVGTVVVRTLRMYSRTDSGRMVNLTAGFLGMLAAALGHSLFDFNFHVFSIMHLLILVGGVTMGGFYRERQMTARPVAKPVWMVTCLVMLPLVALLLVVSSRAAVAGSLTKLAEQDLADLDLMQRDPYAPARRKLQRATFIDSSYWLPYLELGNINKREAFWMRDRDQKAELSRQALAYFEEAHARNAFDMNAVYAIGRTYADLGEDEAAVRFMRQAVTHNPNNVFFATQLGLQLRAMGRPEEALQAFDQAHQSGGWNDPVVQANRKRLRQQLGR